jgi:hypothetical protein
MFQEATSPRIGTRMASQIGNAAAVAGEKLDAAIGYTRERTQALRDSAQHLAVESWDHFRDKAGRIPVAPLLIGLSAGFCLGWYIRSQTTSNR